MLIFFILFLLIPIESYFSSLSSSKSSSSSIYFSTLYIDSLCSLLIYSFVIILLLLFVIFIWFAVICCWCCCKRSINKGLDGVDKSWEIRFCWWEIINDVNSIDLAVWSSRIVFINGNWNWFYRFWFPPSTLIWFESIYCWLFNPFYFLLFF